MASRFVSDVDAEQGQMERRFYLPAFLLVVLSSIAGQAMNVSAVGVFGCCETDDLLRSDFRPSIRRELHVPVQHDIELRSQSVRVALLVADRRSLAASVREVMAGKGSHTKGESSHGLVRQSRAL